MIQTFFSAIAVSLAVAAFSFATLVKPHRDAVDAAQRAYGTQAARLARLQKTAQNLDEYRTEGARLRQSLADAERELVLLDDIDLAGARQTLIMSGECTACRAEPLALRLRQRFALAELVTVRKEGLVTHVELRVRR